MASRKKKRQPAQKTPRVDEPLQLVIDPDAQRALDEHCTASFRNEVCGVLVGFTGVDGQRSWTHVVAIIEGKHAREDQMSVTFTYETWDAVHEALALRRDQARVVGWYHTHPDFGVFYSESDIFVHENFFDLDGQVGIVIDPVRKQRGVFASTPRGLATLQQYEVNGKDRQERGDVLKCTYVAEPLRQGMAEARAAAESAGENLPQSTLDSVEAGMARLEAQMSRLTRLATFGMVIVAAFAFIAGMLFASIRLVPTGSNPSPRMNSPTSAPAIGGKHIE